MNKNIKKIMITLIVAMMILVTMSSCSESISQSDELVVGMEAAYAPYNWTQHKDDNGSVKIDNSGGYANGYDVEIAKTIADKLGKKLVIKKYIWDGLIPALQSGKIDVIIAGMSDTPERRENIDFTSSYYASEMVIVLDKDSPFANAKSINDFKDAKLTGQMGTLHYDLLDLMPGIDKQLALEDFGTMIVATNSGRIDGYISEVPGALGAMTSNKSLIYVEFSKENGFGEKVSVEVGLRKNESELKEEINVALATITEEDKTAIMENAVNIQPYQDEFEDEYSFFYNAKTVIEDYGSYFIKGALMTLFVSLLGTILGLILGIIIGTVKNIPYTRENTFKNIILKIVHGIIFLYVEIFRGTPMMVQAIVLYYGVPLIFGTEGMSVLPASLLILSINTGAYMTEVVRGGIEGVDKGQMEAGKAIGMSHWQIMINVVLPQAIRRILPATGNEFVINIKDTSVLNVITLSELFYNTKDAANSTHLTFEPYLISALVYLFMTVTITQILRLVEKRIDGHDHYTRTSSTMPDHKLNHKSYGKVKKGKRVGR